MDIFLPNGVMKLFVSKNVFLRVALGGQFCPQCVGIGGGTKRHHLFFYFDSSRTQPDVVTKPYLHFLPSISHILSGGIIRGLDRSVGNDDRVMPYSADFGQSKGSRENVKGCFIALVIFS